MLDGVVGGSKFTLATPAIAVKQEQEKHSPVVEEKSAPPPQKKKKYKCIGCARNTRESTCILLLCIINSSNVLNVSVLVQRSIESAQQHIATACKF